MIHLYAHGYEGDELLDFQLKLSNPSSVAQMQKLELISTRFDIAGKVPEGMLDRGWIRKNVLGLNDDEIENIVDGLKRDKAEDSEVESSGQADSGDSGGDDSGDDEGGGLFAGDYTSGQIIDGNDVPIAALANESDEAKEDEEEDLVLSIDDSDAPIKAQNKMRNAFGEEIKKKSDKKTSASIHMPNFKNMTMNKRPQDSMRKPHGSQKLNSFESFERDIDKKVGNSPVMTADIANVLRNIKKSGLLINKNSILNESSDSNGSNFEEDLD